MACIAIQRHKTQTTLTKENPKITPRNPHAQPSPTCNKPSKRLHSSAHIVESHCRLVPTIPSIQKGSIRTGLMRFWHLGAKTTPIVAHVLLILMFPCLWVITPIIPPSYPPHCYPSPKTQKPLLIKKTTSTYINMINHQPHQPHGPSPFNKKNSPAPLGSDPSNSWLVLCHAFWQSSGAPGGTGCRVSTQIVRA